MYRETSRQAYESIRDRVGYKQKVVLEELSKHDNRTNLEIAHELKLPINTVTPRMNELVTMGYVVPDLKRTCTIGGRTSIAWKIKRNVT